MSEPVYDCVIRGGTVGTASAVFQADVGIKGETIVALGADLAKGKREVNAKGKLVLPGGIDTHAHIEQVSSAGLLNADTWESGTAAAAFGGTTTVIAFAAQQRGMNALKVFEDYSKLAKKGAIIDYCYHLIIADPTKETLAEHVPALAKKGLASLKVFMTYDLIKVDDEGVLDIMTTAREQQMMVCVHAENFGMITWMGKQLLSRGYTAPKFHGVYHPRCSEPDAIRRLAHFSALLDQPVMVFHVATAEGVAEIRRARGEGIKMFGETCPQYLFLTKHDVDKPGVDGVKWVCSPPLREASDQEALWQAIALGDLQTVTSDHAPNRLDKTGKFVGGPNPNFKQVPNGMPGIEGRVPLLFDAMVSKGRLGIEKFVDLTATAPARIYNLPKKGSITIGNDADIVIWDPKAKKTFSDETVRDQTGYTPYAGRTIQGVPETVLRRGETIIDKGKLTGKAGSGRFLPRTGGDGARPTGRLAPEMDPKLNFGADLVIKPKVS